MTCAHCDDLRGQLAVAQDELAAWRAHDAADVAEAVGYERRGRWQARFRLTPSEAVILIALVDRRGLPMSVEALLTVSRQTGWDRAREIESNVVGVMISRVRRALSRDALGASISTVRGYGYAVSVEAALALKSRVREA